MLRRNQSGALCVLSRPRIEVLCYITGVCSPGHKPHETWRYDPCLLLTYLPCLTPQGSPSQPSTSSVFGPRRTAGVFRVWRKGGRTPAALALHYWRGNRKASLGQMFALSELCLSAEARSFSGSFRKLKAPGATESAYRYATPARLRGALAAVLKNRRSGESLQRKARKLLEEVAQC